METKSYFEVYGYQFALKDKGGHWTKRGMDENELWTEILLDLEDPDLLGQFETLEEAKEYCSAQAPRRVWTAKQRSVFTRQHMIRGYCLYIEENERDEDMEWMGNGDIYSVFVEPIAGEEAEDAEN